MEGIARVAIVKEVKKQLALAGPLFTIGLLLYSLQMIALMFVGHLGEAALSGASLATSFAAVTGFNLLVGLSSALETLCGQSFGGEKHHMLSVYTQRAMIVLSLFSVILAVIWANTKPILIAMHQDINISEEAGQYASYMIPSLFAYGLLQCLLRFLQAQNNVLPMVLTAGITCSLHILLCWTLVFKIRLGIKGAAVATSISSWINVLLIGLYIKFSPSCAKTWTGFSKEAFHNIFPFVRVAIPSALMLCAMTWTFELMVILSGLLPNPKLETSVLSICLNTFGLVWMIPYGLSASVSTRVSNELGAGNPRAAYLAAMVVLCMVLLEGTLLVSAMVLLRRVWGHVYTNDKEVIDYVATMMPILATSSFFDGIQSVISGVARGCGWQKIGACVNIGSYYLVGVPVSVILAFVLHIRAKGLWLGIVSALIVQVLLLLTITMRTDWEKQASKAVIRLNDSTIIEDEVKEGQRINV